MAISVSNPFVQAFMGQISAAEDKRKQEEQNALNLMMSGFDVAPQQTKGVGDALSQALYGPSTAVSRASVGQHHPGVIQKTLQQMRDKSAQETAEANRKNAIKLQEMVNESFKYSADKQAQTAADNREFEKSENALDRAVTNYQTSTGNQLRGREIDITRLRMEQEHERGLATAIQEEITKQAKIRLDEVKRRADHEEKMLELAQKGSLTPEQALTYLSMETSGMYDQYLIRAAESDKNFINDLFTFDYFGLDEDGAIAAMTDPKDMAYSPELAELKNQIDRIRKNRMELLGQVSEVDLRFQTGEATKFGQSRKEIISERENEEIKDTLDGVEEAGDKKGDPDLSTVGDSLNTQQNTTPNNPNSIFQAFRKLGLPVRGSGLEATP